MRTTKAWRRVALANTAVLALSTLSAVALHAGAPVAAPGREISVEDGLRLIAAQAGTYDMFLVFEGTTNVPKGEATFPSTGAIAVNGFSLGVENPVALGASSGGAGTGKVKFNELKITKAIDSASPTMFQDLASGAHMTQLTLLVRKAGLLTNTAYLQWQFGLVFFKNIDWSGDPGSLSETVTLTYGSLRIQYAKINPNGSLSPPTTTQWNQATNSGAYTAS